jgi:hypothetical protein
MTTSNDKPVSSQNSDAEAIRHLREAMAAGRHWYLALLEAMGRWASTEETVQDGTYRYLIGGEAFDWLRLAERLCQTVEDLPEDERDALLFYGRPPLKLSAGEVKGLIGQSKYAQYLNYFYGITVEEALLLAVQEEIEKEKRVLGYRGHRDTTDEAHQRVYNVARADMLQQFRQEKGYAQTEAITLTEMKEFTYWLFKYRLKHAEKARIASDTKKALDFLKRQWQQRGIFGVLTREES